MIIPCTSSYTCLQRQLQLQRRPQQQQQPQQHDFNDLHFRHTLNKGTPPARRSRGSTSLTQLFLDAVLILGCLLLGAKNRRLRKRLRLSFAMCGLVRRSRLRPLSRTTPSRAHPWLEHSDVLVVMDIKAMYDTCRRNLNTQRPTHLVGPPAHADLLH